MIKHVVCYRLYERTEEKKQEVKEMFMSMKDKIEYIKEIQVGLDFLKSERSYDVVLEITFNSVLLPLPLSPVITTNSPMFNSKLILENPLATTPLL